MTDTRAPAVFRMYWIYDEAGDLLYIGESNDALRRFVEHLRDKRWAGEVADHRRDRRVFASKAEAQAAEKAAVEKYRPRFNVEYNQGNPDRVDPHTMRYPDGRLYRPDLYHQPGADAPASRTQFSRRVPAPVRREWTRRQKQAAAVAAVWVVLAAGGWWAVCRWLPVGLADGAVDGAVAASTLLTLAGALSVRTRGRGAGWGRFWRALGLAAAAAGAVFLLWHLGPAIMPVEIVPAAP